MKKLLALVLSIVFVVSFALTASASHDDVQYEIIDEQLREAIQGLGHDDLVPVSIWINEIDYDEVEKLALEKCGINRELVYCMIEKGTDGLLSLEQIDAYIDAERSIYSSMQGIKNKEFVNTHLATANDENRVLFVSKYTSLIVTKLHVNEIKELCKDNKSVVSIKLHYNAIAGNYDSIYAQNTHALHSAINTPIESYLRFHGVSTLRDNYNLNGDGIRIGQLELSIPNVNLPCFSNSLIATNTSNAYPSSCYDPRNFLHASSVAFIICSNDSDAKGGVPNAQLYCEAISDMLQYMQAVESLLDNGVHLINMSAGFTFTDYDEVEEIVTWTDHIAIRHSVHFITSAGNTWETETEPLDYRVSAPAIAYNCIAVGNCSRIGWCEESRYITPSGLANKPDISACGVSCQFPSYLSEASGQTGTSFSSPIVSCVVAQMIQYRPSLAVAQDLLKSILLASVSNSTLQFDTVNTIAQFDKSGAGAVNAVASRNTIARGTTASSYFSATASSGSTKTYRYTVNSSNTKIRVALTWLHYITINSNCSSSSQQPAALANLDLTITGPSGQNISYSSYTIPGNVEIIQFEPVVSGSYTVTVTYYGPSTARTYFGLSWWAE